MTVEDLFAEIGRLHMANQALQRRVRELEAAAETRKAADADTATEA